MTYGILGRAAIAAGITAVLAGTAQAQGAAKGAPRLVLGDARALIVCAPVTAVKSPPTIRQIPKAQPKAGSRPATSLPRVPWPDKTAMFQKAGIAVMTEDSSSMFVLDGKQTFASNGQGALWARGGELWPSGVVTAGGEVTVGVVGQFAREHPSLQLHFYLRNNSMSRWTVHNLIDSSDMEVPLPPKIPVEMVILVNVPANLVTDDRLDAVYGLVTLGLTQKVPWEFQRVEVMPVSTR